MIDGVIKVLCEVVDIDEVCNFVCQGFYVECLNDDGMVVLLEEFFVEQVDVVDEEVLVEVMLKLKVVLVVKKVLLKLLFKVEFVKKVVVKILKKC